MRLLMGGIDKTLSSVVGRVLSTNLYFSVSTPMTASRPICDCFPHAGGAVNARRPERSSAWQVRPPIVTSWRFRGWMPFEEKEDTLAHCGRTWAVGGGYAIPLPPWKALFLTFPDNVVAP